MLILFEGYLILSVLFLFNSIKKAKAIYFYDSYQSLKFLSFLYNWKKSATIKLIKFIRKDISISFISSEEINKYRWISNKESLKIIDNIGILIKNTSVYKVVFSIIKSEEIIKYYKHFLAKSGYISSKLTFYKIIKEFLNNEEQIIIVPHENNYFIFEKDLSYEKFRNFIPFFVIKINNIMHLFKKFIHTMIFIFFPILYLIREIIKKGITLKKNIKQKHDILIKIVWGFSEDGYKLGLKFNADDGFLYNPSLGLTDLFFVYDRNKYGPKVRENSKKVMQKRGFSYIDKKEYKVNILFIFKIIQIQILIILNPLRFISFFKIHYLFIYISWRIIYDIMNKLLEMEYIDYKVEFCRNDANSDHIVQNILSTKKGKRSVMTHHTGSPYEMPQLAYIYCDRYLIHGELYKKLFYPYWEGIKIERTGRLNLDWVAKFFMSNENKNDLKKRYKNLYPQKKYTVLIFFPSVSNLVLESQWDEMLKALSEFKEYNIDANVFLRFRNLHIDEINSKIEKFRELTKRDSRIIIDHTNFTSYELINLCDLFIACNASFGINEAIITGTKIFTFDYTGFAKYWFAEYGKDFVLNKKQDVLRVFKGLENNFEGFDCKWDLLKKDLNYYYDGKNLERIQKIVVETIKEIDNNFKKEGVFND